MDVGVPCCSEGFGEKGTNGVSCRDIFQDICMGLLKLFLDSGEAALVGGGG